ncbi:hypothetical protein [Celerinatantimonas sp. YJH-8]|uniref:hypothetical protein n=1 Tax=Celerinatantimonas sp. YJH-8 TaxID=3228714 RepID=UPI0038CB8D05
MRFNRPEMTFHWRESIAAGRPVLSVEIHLAPQPQIRPLLEDDEPLRGAALSRDPHRSENLEQAMFEYLTTQTTMRKVAAKWGVSSTTLCRHLGLLNQVSRGELVRKLKN